MIEGEKKLCGGYSQSNAQINSMKTHPLKHRYERKIEICGGYLQPNTSKNSMKTHLLKYRHDMRREKRYVVVTRSLIH